MNNMEETLWNYIDGNCTPEEQKLISTLIAEDEAYRLKYQELLSLNKDFSTAELDEPSMAFTYKVMEAVRAESALPPLKTGINKRVIRGIGVFFAAMLTVFLVFTFANVSFPAHTQVSIPLNLKMPQVDPRMTKMAIEAFLFLDVIVGLYLADAWLRKKRADHHA